MNESLTLASQISFGKRTTYNKHKQDGSLRQKSSKRELCFQVPGRSAVCSCSHSRHLKCKRLARRKPPNVCFLLLGWGGTQKKHYFLREANIKEAISAFYFEKHVLSFWCFSGSGGRSQRETAWFMLGDQQAAGSQK